MRRLWLILGYLLAVAGLAGGIWTYGYRQALDQLAERAEADLALATDRLSAQLQRYQETAVLLSDHPLLNGAETETAGDAVRSLLLEVADKTVALNVIYADSFGRVVASARGDGPVRVQDTDYFSRAMQGSLGSGHSVQDLLQRRVFYYAAPDFAFDGAVQGALIIVVDIENIEWDWRGSTPAVFFTDMAGNVFISNRSELLFWRRVDGGAGLVPAAGDALPFSTNYVGAHEIWRLDWGPYLPTRALHLARDLPVIGMTGEVLVDAAPARRLAGLQVATVVAICLAFGALLFLATERRRTLAQANAVLESRVAMRTRALSSTNAQLRHEIVERQEAEAALKQAQADLVQAGKLSALGQMSAGISHELNQPLMAIRQFADNGAAFMKRGQTEKAGDNLNRISDMAARMARIIQNLRSFARNESEPMGKVNLVDVLNTAVELTETRLKAEKVHLVWEPPNGTVAAWGGEVRLVQVFVNLINNAADAMAGQGEKNILIRLENGPRLVVRLSDTGPGIADPQKIFEPFYSTKAVGSSEGMGLGLSISYGLVQSFGGNIRGANSEHGAEFTVELERYSEGEAA